MDIQLIKTLISKMGYRQAIDFLYLEDELNLDMDKVKAYLKVLENYDIIHFPYASNDTYCELTSFGFELVETNCLEQFLSHRRNNLEVGNSSQINIGQIIQGSRFENKATINQHTAYPIKKEEKSIFIKIFDLITNNGLISALLAAVILACIGKYCSWF